MSDAKAHLLQAIGHGDDFTVQGQPGESVFILRGHTPACQEWINEHVQAESWQHFGGGIAIEHRYIGDIVNALCDEGFTGGNI